MGAFESAPPKRSTKEKADSDRPRSKNAGAPGALNHQLAMSSLRPSGVFRRVENYFGGPGQPLDAQQRAHFEPLLQHDLSEVRVHADARAAASADALDARAYTVGQDIVFGAEGYRPDTADGRRLLGHELAHTVQQVPAKSSGLLSPGLRVSDEGEPAERDAERATSAMLTSRPVALTAGTVATHVQRAPNKSTMLSPAKVRADILALGEAGVNEIVNKLPASLWTTTGAGTDVKTVKVGNVTHVFNYGIKMLLTAPSVLSTAAGVTQELMTVKQGTPTAPILRHTLGTQIFQTMPTFIETVFHELVHARLIIDSDLPDADKSTLGRRYAMLNEATGRTGLAIMLGLTPLHDAVVAGIDAVKGWYLALDPTVAGGLKAEHATDSLYEFLVNEKFVNTESSTEFGHPKANSQIARSYAKAVSNRFQLLIQDLGLFQKFNTARSGVIGQLLDDRVTALEKALIPLYDAMDRQAPTVNDIAATPVPTTSGPPLMPIAPLPVKLP